MTISLKHAFTTGKADGGDVTRVRPTNWNAEHVLIMATNKLIGRATAGTGAAEEIDCTALARTILAAATSDAVLAALGVSAFTTGDIKPTLKTTADTGWIMCNDGTIGSATSGATTRANADTQNLYTLLWTNVGDTYAPVSGGRGASAAADFAANKPIALTKMLGRALASAGAGSGLTSRALGLTNGAESVALAESELPAHSHTANSVVTDPGHNHDLNASSSLGNYQIGAGGNLYSVPGTNSTAIVNHTTGISVATSVSSVGSGAAHNNMQPSSFVNFMIKL